MGCSPPGSADHGVDVLVLEAGSYLFPTHIGNLPRRLKIGQFDKHVWSLWEDFKVTNYVNTPGSQFAGGQAFNLGGRSLFWGGLIPRQVGWELAKWPASVRNYLLGNGYAEAEKALNRAEPIATAYQAASRGVPGRSAARLRRRGRRGRGPVRRGDEVVGAGRVVLHRGPADGGPAAAGGVPPGPR